MQALYSNNFLIIQILIILPYLMLTHYGNIVLYIHVKKLISQPEGKTLDFYSHSLVLRLFL